MGQHTVTNKLNEEVVRSKVLIDESKSQSINSSALLITVPLMPSRAPVLEEREAEEVCKCIQPGTVTAATAS